MNALIIDLNDAIYLRDEIQRKEKLVESLIELKPPELTLGDFYNMSLDIQRLKTKLQLLIKEKRTLCRI